ncbi:MAG: hypothetical protein U0640_16005 [Phycisphaerales bacterium]
MKLFGMRVTKQSGTVRRTLRAAGLALVIAVGCPAAFAQDALKVPGSVVGGLRQELNNSKDLMAQTGAGKREGGVDLRALAADAKAEMWNVALLSGGRVIGRGVDGTSQGALREATRDARARMPYVNDALQEAVQVKQVREALISAEVARQRTALEIVTYFDADSAVRAGLEGVLVVPPADVKDGKVAVVFPSEMLAMGKTVPQSLVAAISDASGDAALAMPGIPGQEAGDLIKAGWKFEKFRVEHQVELVRGGTAMSLTRGGRVVEEREIRLDELKRWRDGIKKHIWSRGRDIQNGQAMTLVADYMPSLDRDGAGADLLERTIAHWAGNINGRENVIAPFTIAESPQDLDEYRAWARRDFAATAARCLCVFVKKKSVRDMKGVVEYPDDDARVNAINLGDITQNQRAKIDARVVREAFCLEHGWDARVPEPARGLVALAMVRMLSEQQLRDEKNEFGAQARAAVQSLLASGQPGSLVRYMPWLGWAAVELSPPETQIDGTLKWPELAGAPVLREMRTLIWQKQIDLATAQAEGLDLKGAILFGQGVEARRQIGWQTARPVAFIATMLRDPRLTSQEERNAEIVRLIAGMRFLRQLTLDETSTWRTPRADRAMYGVRNAPWDHRQSLEASVMTLLAVEEMIGSLE